MCTVAKANISFNASQFTCYYCGLSCGFAKALHNKCTQNTRHAMAIRTRHGLNYLFTTFHSLVKMARSYRRLMISHNNQIINLCITRARTTQLSRLGPNQISRASCGRRRLACDFMRCLAPHTFRTHNR